MPSNDSIFKQGLVVQKKKEQASLLTRVKAFQTSINQVLFRHPFDLHRIDTEAVRSLTDEMIACIEQYKRLQAEIEELEG